jgi:hypothetical protein
LARRSRRAQSTGDTQRLRVCTIDRLCSGFVGALQAGALQATHTVRNLGYCRLLLSILSPEPRLGVAQFKRRSIASRLRHSIISVHCCSRRPCGSGGVVTEISSRGLAARAPLRETHPVSAVTMKSACAHGKVAVAGISSDFRRSRLHAVPADGSAIKVLVNTCKRDLPAGLYGVTRIDSPRELLDRIMRKSEKCWLDYERRVGVCSLHVSDSFR